MKLSDLPQPDRKKFKNNSAVRLHSLCEQCGRGTMSNTENLDDDERMDEGCGRLLAVGCTNKDCGNRDYAYRDKTTGFRYVLVTHSICSGHGCAMCDNGIKII